jgi:NAD(P)-dependent dehydrogenase (short-subunit alcohol dehydrogenase family)
MLMTEFNLAGRVGVVTGAARGLGLEISKFLSDLGAEVIMADIDAATVEEAASTLLSENGKVRPVRCDVSSAEGLTELVSEVAAGERGLDFLVNNAALYAELPPVRLEDIDPDLWDRVQNVNVKGIWNCSRLLLPALTASGRGRVVNIASAIAFRASPMALHYVSSKAAILGLTKAMAREVGDRNVTVNAVAPGFTWTRSSLDKVTDESELDAQKARRSLRRAQMPDDIVGPVAFFCSDLASYITGQTLIVDGGSHMI